MRYGRKEKVGNLGFLDYRKRQNRSRNAEVTYVETEDTEMLRTEVTEGELAVKK